MRFLMQYDPGHGDYTEERRTLFADLSLEDVIAGAAASEVIEDYPHDDAGPAVLMLQRDAGGSPLHVIWRIEAATAGPALLITAYRPDAAQWSADFRTRNSGLSGGPIS